MLIQPRQMEVEIEKTLAKFEYSYGSGYNRNKLDFACETGKTFGLKAQKC